jgi:hypothetical protein
MHELLAIVEPEPGHIIGLVAVVGAFACGMVSIVMGIRFASRRIELDAALKQDMLNRGMTAEEIRIVMEASSGTSRQYHHHKDPMVAEV